MQKLSKIDTHCLQKDALFPQAYTVHQNLLLLRNARVKLKEIVQRKRKFSHFADFKELVEKYVARDASSYMQRIDRNADLPKP